MFAKKMSYFTGLVAVSLVVAACGSSGSSEGSGGGSSEQSSSTSSSQSSPAGGSTSESEPTSSSQSSTSPESSESSGSSSSSSGSTSQSSSSSGGEISATSFTLDFSAMKQLKSVAQAGKGKITAILPDTVTSARYTEFDAPFLKKAFETAGLTSDQYSIVNAQGSASGELTDAQTAISAGASVLIMDPLDSGTGAQIEKYAKSHGVPVVDYDRLTLGGSRDYYVSFNNVNVGKLIGKGFEQCISDWGVKDPKFIEMKGDPTDNNATLFAQGYDSVVDPKVKSGEWERVAEPAGTWKPPQALTLFQQALTANPKANAAIIPNDENAAPIITYLKNHNVKPKTFPITGQDATLVGLQNVLSGYQCGTVYKAIYLEAQAAVALALYLRAGQTPPSSLVNGTTKDTKSGTDVKAVLLPPTWVTTKNMNDTVIKDKFVPAAKLCKGFEDACKAAGISS